MSGKVNRKIKNKGLTEIILKTQKILELERRQTISLLAVDSPNKPLKNKIIDWFRKGIMGGYLYRIAEQQNQFNNLAYELIRELYNEVTSMQIQLYHNKKYIDKEFFDKDYYKGGTKSTYVDYSIHEEVFKEFTEILNSIFRPKKVLDAGCAYGFLVKHFRTIGVEAYGIDISSFAVKKANSPYIKVADISSLKCYKDNGFDLVICLETLEHITSSQISKALKELVRVSKKWVLLTIATKEEEKCLDLSHISVFPREFWESQFKLLNLKQDRDMEKKLNRLHFNKKTNWQNHYFVLTVGN